ANASKLGSQKESFTSSFEGFSDQNFVGMRAVDIGRVEKIDAKFERAINGGQRLLFVSGSVELAHAHTAQAHGRNLRAVRTQSTYLHPAFPSTLLRPVFGHVV